MKEVIKVDSRETHAEYVSYLKADSRVLIVESSLKSGDILINGLGIERKTVTDFLLTLNEGRLFDQLQRLKASYRRHLLLIEGRGLRIHLDQERFLGIYIRITAGWQIPIIHTQNGEQTARSLIRICNQDAHASAGPIRARPRNPDYRNDSVALRMLMEIPLIGPKGAAALLKSFGNIERIFRATEKELLLVNGIGPKLARNILDVNSSRYQLEGMALPL